MKEKATVEKVYPRKRNTAMPTLCKFLTDRKQMLIQCFEQKCFQ